MKPIDDNHITIQGWMVTKLNLKGRELQTFALVYGFSQDEESEFYGSLQYVMQWLSCSKPTAIAVLDGLVKDGLFIRREGRKGIESNRYVINFEVVKKLRLGGKETLPVVVKKLNHSGKETLPDNTIYSTNENIAINSNVVFDENDPEYLVTVVGIESAKEKETEVSPVVEIISYLNEKVGAKYRATTKDYITSINARLKEDYTVADFKQVIDFKAAQWSNDPKMSEYLRPSTLFIRKHFDEYLNAPKITASRANTNDALKDCTLPADIAPRYEAYFNHALQTYPALLESATKVFSHCDYLDYWNNTSTPGLPFSLTPSDKRRVMLTVHEQLNANKYLREKYSSVFAAYLVAVKQSMKQETIKL